MSSLNESIQVFISAAVASSSPSSLSVSAPSSSSSSSSPPSLSVEDLSSEPFSKCIIDEWIDSLTSRGLLPSFMTEIVYHPMYYLFKFWDDNSDPFISSYWDMPHGFPYNWILMVIFVVYLIKIWAPNYMQNREPLEVRPWMLFVDGVAFGGYITALLTTLWFSYGYSDAFICNSYKSHWPESIDQLWIKHFAYAYSWGKLYDFWIPLFKILRKRQSISDLHLLHNVIATLGAVALIKIQPGGLLLFLGVMEGIHQVITYGFLLFCAASPYDHHRPPFYWKQIVLASRLLMMSTVLAHTMYFLTKPNCGLVIVKLGLAAYCVLMLIVAPLDFYNTEMKKSQIRRQSVVKRYSLINQLTPETKI